MDAYAEQLVVKEESSSDGMKKIGIVVAAAVAVILLIYLTLRLTPIAVVIAFGVIYGAYFLLNSMNVEYEYIITNGSLDIDKIIAKRKRITLLSVDVKNFTNLGFYNEDNGEYDGTVYMAVGGSERKVFADFGDEQNGEARLIFSPDEKVLNCIKPYLPRTIRFNLNEGE